MEEVLSDEKINDPGKKSQGSVTIDGKDGPHDIYVREKGLSNSDLY